MTWKTEEHVGNGIRTKIWRSSGSTASVRADRSVHQRVTLAHDFIPVRRLASKINRILGPGFREEVARLSHKGRSVVAVLDSWKTLGAANKNPSLELIRALGESERRQLVSRWAEEDGYRDPRYMLHQAFEAVLNMTRFFSPSTVKTLTDEGVNVDAGEVHELLCSPAFFVLRSDLHGHAERCHCYQKRHEHSARTTSATLRHLAAQQCLVQH